MTWRVTSQAVTTRSTRHRQIPVTPTMSASDVSGTPPGTRSTSSRPVWPANRRGGGVTVWSRRSATYTCGSSTPSQREPCGAGITTTCPPKCVWGTRCGCTSSTTCSTGRWASCASSATGAWARFPTPNTPTCRTTTRRDHRGRRHRPRILGLVPRRTTNVALPVLERTKVHT